MKTVIEKKYIKVPVNTNATTKKLCFYEMNGEEKKLVMDFDCRLDFIDPTFTAYLDVSRFAGHELEYESIPYIDFTLTQCDEKNLDGLYEEKYRPFVHFTPQSGWLNDPNGMIKYHGTYHMFYQYNPCGPEWGNMHWGHAVSKDLIHWEEKDVALFPDETGTMYSGSAIEDAGNVSGIQTGENSPMLLFYTAAGDRNLMSAGKVRTQCIAFSDDGGKTFKKYSGNPVINFVENYNRDPKVVWVEEIKKYLIVLYLADDRYGMFVSENLLSWTFLQQIVIPNESECPDIYSFRTEKKKYWVISGASDKYIIGVFEKGTFSVKTREAELSYSGFSYAGQSFSGMDDGRVVRMTWEKLKMPCPGVPNQMSFPQELKLAVTDKECFLTANPVEEIKQLYVSPDIITNRLIDKALEIKLDMAAYDIHIVTDFDSNMRLELFGHTLQIRTQENCIVYEKVKIPISSDLRTVDLRIIADRCSFEIFTDGGRFFANLYVVCDYNLPYLRLLSDGNINLQKLFYSKLEPIHGKLTDRIIP